jgi:hypothetical protein
MLPANLDLLRALVGLTAHLVREGDHTATLEVVARVLAEPAINQPMQQPVARVALSEPQRLTASRVLPCGASSLRGDAERPAKVN